ncbi:MAG: hypothetical protein ACLFTB_03320 [Desulfovibrionales bacterium]
MLWAAATGEVHPALGTAIFFELLWLDFIPAGTFIPPHHLLSLFLTFGTCTLLGLATSQEVSLVIMATLPLAWLGTSMEGIKRTMQNVSYNLLAGWARGAGRKYPPERLVKRGIFQSMVLDFFLFLVLQSGLYLLFGFIVDLWGNILFKNPLSWAHLWLLASLGPVLSLRHRLPYIGLALAILLAGLFLWFGAPHFGNPPSPA